MYSNCIYSVCVHKNNNNSRCYNGVAMVYPYTNIKIYSCCGIRSQILVGHVGGSMTLSVHSQSWRCGHWWEWSVCATVCLGSCRTPGWKEDRVSSAASPARQACQGNQAPADPRVQMAMWVSREEMAEMAGRGKRERRETQVYYK